MRRSRIVRDDDHRDAETIFVCTAIFIYTAIIWWSAFAIASCMRW